MNAENRDALFLNAMDASGMTPEEFGRLLYTATSIVDLDSPGRRLERNLARCKIRHLPGGDKLLD